MPSGLNWPDRHRSVGKKWEGTAMFSRCRLQEFVTAAGIFLLGGCAQKESLRLLVTGPESQISAVTAKAYADNQEQVHQQLLKIANLSSEPNVPAEWQEFINAGFLVSDQKCDAYLDALFRLDRAKDTTLNQLTLTGATTAAVMGLLEASATAIAATAAAFGYTGSTIENLGNSVLYEIEPSSISGLVHKLQKRYREGVTSAGSYQGRATAFSVIQYYIRICLPTQIETEVNSAVKASAVFVSAGDAVKGQPPAVSTDPQLVSFNLSGEGAKKLERSVCIDYPACTNIDSEKIAGIKSCYERAGVPDQTLVIDFMFQPAFEVQRGIVASCMGL